jgi:hypothetical protein
MPGGDGTGPRGMGPMTGRGAGYCAGFPGPGYLAGPRRGVGFGFGGGRGRGNWFRPDWGPYGGVERGYYPYPYRRTREEEIELLRADAQYLRETLDEIVKRIEELEQEQGHDTQRKG